MGQRQEARPNITNKIETPRHDDLVIFAREFAGVAHGLARV
jgi:hypothetical protein